MWNTSPESSAADSAVAIGAPICHAATATTVSAPSLSTPCCNQPRAATYGAAEAVLAGLHDALDGLRCPPRAARARHAPRRRARHAHPHTHAVERHVWTPGGGERRSERSLLPAEASRAAGRPRQCCDHHHKRLERRTSLLRARRADLLPARHPPLWVRMICSRSVNMQSINLFSDPRTPESRRKTRILSRENGFATIALHCAHGMSSSAACRVVDGGRARRSGLQYSQ